MYTSKRILRAGFVLVLVLNSVACSMFVSKVTQDIGQQLNQTIINSNDPATVAQAMPAYLLLMESAAQKDNASSQSLSNLAKMYAAYASLFVTDKERQQRLSSTALHYAELSVCRLKSEYCHITTLPYEKFARLFKISSDDKKLWYVLGQCWALWIKVNANDWNAVAQLAQVKQIMQEIIRQDETLDDGGAHIVLGILNSLVPPALGGKPELAKKHFEKAIQLSGGKNLSVQVAIAEHYARLVFDQALHDDLLNKVINTNPVQNNYVLINVIAQQRAKQLLKTSPDYF